MKRLHAALLATCFLSPLAHAEIPGNKVKIGVLTDMSGPFADQVGAGSVAAAKLAAQDFAPESGGLAVEVVSADHQNKPDVGSGIARRWLDQEGVDAIVDLPNSGVALAVVGRRRRTPPRRAGLQRDELGHHRQGLPAHDGAMGERHLGAGQEHRARPGTAGPERLVFPDRQLRAGPGAGE